MAQSDQQKLEQLKGKYQSVLSLMTQQSIQVQNVHIQDGKLFIRGTAPSQEAKNRVWDQIKLIDPNYSDLTADITVSAASDVPTQGNQFISWDLGRHGSPLPRLIRRSRIGLSKQKIPLRHR